jgi:hypothetical protein
MKSWIFVVVEGSTVMASFRTRAGVQAYVNKYMTGRDFYVEEIELFEEYT